MCGNTDIWGTMKQLGDHTGSSWYDTNNFTHLGRVHFGGSGSGNERTIVQQSFNSNANTYKKVTSCHLTATYLCEEALL